MPTARVTATMTITAMPPLITVAITAVTPRITADTRRATTPRPIMVPGTGVLFGRHTHTTAGLGTIVGITVIGDRRRAGGSRRPARAVVDATGLPRAVLVTAADARRPG